MRVKRWTRSRCDALFLLLTALGASIWTGALAAVGYLMGARFEGVERYLGLASTVITAALLVAYVWRVIGFKSARAR